VSEFPEETTDAKPAAKQQDKVGEKKGQKTERETGKYSIQQDLIHVLRSLFLPVLGVRSKHEGRSVVKKRDRVNAIHPVPHGGKQFVLR
jgi:hypothetical protein